MINCKRAAHRERAKAQGREPTARTVQPSLGLDVCVTKPQTQGLRRLHHSETSRYEQPVALLASGGFKKVYVAWHQRTSSLVVFRTEDIAKTSQAKEARRTASLEQHAGGRFAPLRFLEEQPNLWAKMHGERPTFVIVSPLAESELGLALDALHSQPPSLRRASVRYAAEQILLDLHRLHHDKKLLHNDIKPANCLVASDGTVHVHDFNLSMHKHEGPTRSLMGTEVFIAPELTRAHNARQPVPYSEASDMYAMGLTIMLVAAQVHTGQPSGRSAAASDDDWEADTEDTLGSDGWEALLDATSGDPAQRPSAMQFVQSLRVTDAERVKGAAFFSTQHQLGDKARAALNSSTREPIDARLQNWAELDTHWGIQAPALA